MTSPSERLASSLEVLHRMQEGGRHVFRSEEVPRYHRDRLRRHGFLRQVIKGWWISWRPDVPPGDTTPWCASMWEFCARYCAHRFGEEWHLSPEQSILIHAEAMAIPKQVVVYAPRGTNNSVDLLFGTRVYDLKVDSMPPGEDLMERDGLRLLSPAAALTKVPESFFQRYPVEAQVNLGSIGDASDVLGHLLEGGHPVVAGRLAGAFRRVGRAEVADEIVAAMRAAGHEMRETDPFDPAPGLAEVPTHAPPIVERLEAIRPFATFLAERMR